MVKYLQWTPSVAIYGHQMKYVSSLSSLPIFLGALGTNTFSTDIYQYDFGNTAVGWTVFTVLGQKPPGREYQSGSYCDQTGEFYLFGGKGASANYMSNKLIRKLYKLLSFR